MFDPIQLFCRCLILCFPYRLSALGARSMPGVKRVDVILQQSWVKAKGVPKRLSKTEQAKRAEEEWAKERAVPGRANSLALTDEK